MHTIMTRSGRAAGLLLATFALAACASGGAATDGASAAAAADGMTLITVQNDHRSGRDMVIYLEPEGRGERSRIGVSPSGEAVSFTVPADRGRYRFVGGHQLGDITSPWFNLTAPSTVRWVLSTDRVTVSRR
jgi:ABC-type sugar transport system substrate-binding protein